MIWSKWVAGSSASAIAAAGVTRSARPRMSTTRILLPSPFIFANSTVSAITPHILGFFRPIWRKTPAITSPGSGSAVGDVEHLAGRERPETGGVNFGALQRLDQSLHRIAGCPFGETG